MIFEMWKFRNLFPFLWGVMIVSCEKNENPVNVSNRSGKTLNTNCAFCNVGLTSGRIINPFLIVPPPVHPITSSSSSDSAGSENDIYKGRPAHLDQYPYTVQLSLRHPDGRGSICSGSIFTRYTIITAAHCVYQGRHLLQPGHSKVHAGTTEANRGTSRTIVKFIPHPRYKGAWTPNEDRFDIALVILDHPLNFTRGIHPIALAPRGKIRRGKACILSAFGSTTGGIPEPGTIFKKQYAPMVIRDDRDCQRNYPRTMFDARSNVCAGGNGRSRQCSGDSGGPLACHYGSQNHLHLYGVVDSSKKSNPAEEGSPCSDPSPGTYAYVPYYAHWIRHHAKH